MAVEKWLNACSILKGIEGRRKVGAQAFLITCSYTVLSAVLGKNESIFDASPETFRRYCSLAHDARVAAESLMANERLEEKMPRQLLLILTRNCEILDEKTGVHDDEQAALKIKLGKKEHCTIIEQVVQIPATGSTNFKNMAESLDGTISQLCLDGEWELGHVTSVDCDSATATFRNSRGRMLQVPLPLLKAKIEHTIRIRALK